MALSAMSINSYNRYWRYSMRQICRKKGCTDKTLRRIEMWSEEEEAGWRRRLSSRRRGKRGHQTLHGLYLDVELSSSIVSERAMRLIRRIYQCVSPSRQAKKKSKENDRASYGRMGQWLSYGEKGKRVLRLGVSFYPIEGGQSQKESPKNVMISSRYRAGYCRSFRNGTSK